MNTTLLAVIGSALTLAIGLFKYLTDKTKEAQRKVEEAAKEIEDGINEGNTSKITAGFSRINRK